MPRSSVKDIQCICRRVKEAETMKNKQFKKWASYVLIVIAGVAIGGDFGLLTAIALIDMLQ